MKLGPTDKKADLVPVLPYVWYVEEHHQQLNMPSVWGMNIVCMKVVLKRRFKNFPV